MADDQDAAGPRDQRRRAKAAKAPPNSRSPKAIVGAIFGRKAPSVKDTLTVVGLKKALIVGLLSNNSEVSEGQHSIKQRGQQESKPQSTNSASAPKCESESMSSLSLEDKPKEARLPTAGATASTKPKAVPVACAARAKRRSQIASFHASFASSSVSSHSSDEASASPSKKASGAHSRRRTRGAAWHRPLEDAEDEETSSPETDSSATSFATLMFAKDMPKLSQKYLQQIPLRESGPSSRPACKSAPTPTMCTFGSDPSLAADRRERDLRPSYVRKRPPRRHSNFMHAYAERAEVRRGSELPKPKTPLLSAGMKSLSTNLPPQRGATVSTPQSPKASAGRPFHSTYSNLLTVPDPFPWESASPARPIVKPRHSRSLSIRTQLQRQESFEKSATSSLEGESTPTAESLPKLRSGTAEAATATLLPALCARCSKSLDQIEEDDGDEAGADGGLCESEGYVSTVRRKKSACSAWQRSQSCNDHPSNTTCVSVDIHKENSEDESSNARVKVTDL